MGQVISGDGTAIAYERVGGGPAVILVDGALGHRALYGQRALAEALRPHLTAITYDRRGRGDSADTPPYAPEREIEDLAALIGAAGPAGLYGVSSGAVLALRAAAAALGPARVPRLALYEPPLDAPDDDEAQDAYARYVERVDRALAAGRRDEALELFLGDMLPPEEIAALRGTPEWPAMEAVAHTLAYDNAVLGDGTVPLAIARAVTVPTLVLVGGASPPFKRAAADALVAAMPRAESRVLSGETTMASPEILAPVLAAFLGGRAEERARG